MKHSFLQFENHSVQWEKMLKEMSCVCEGRGAEKKKGEEYLVFTQEKISSKWSLKAHTLVTINM